MDVIKLSPLYHDVKVGCLYCYYNAAIHPGKSINDVITHRHHLFLTYIIDRSPSDTW